MVETIEKMLAYFKYLLKNKTRTLLVINKVI